MIFKEAFENYRNGNATHEEITFVESEIEKNKLISDYIDEELEINFDIGNNPKNEINKIKSSLKKRTRNIIFATVPVIISITITLILLFVYVGVPAVNNAYYNPNKKTIDEDASDLDLSLAAFTELYFPGYSYNDTITENTGIGKYSLTFISDNTYNWTREYTIANIDKGVIDMPNSFSDPVLPLNAFANSSYPTYELDDESKSIITNKLNELPEYFTVIATLSFTNDLTLDEIISLESGSNVLFIWAGIRNAPLDKQLYPICGIDLMSIGPVYENINNTYPAFEMAFSSDRSASIYETHFKSLLKYQIDHTEFESMLTSQVGNNDYYKRVLDYVSENGVKSYGVLVKGSPKDILNLLNSGLVSQIRPLDTDISF